MGLRYRKSKKIAPGVRLNLSAKSASVSVGPKGFKKTFSTSGRTTTTVRIPGTGLSYSTTKKSGAPAASSASEAPAAAPVRSEKSKGVALCLCVFLGFFGAHRFYVGKTGTGVLWFFTVGGLAFGLVYDLIMICCNKFTDKSGAVLGLKVEELAATPREDQAFRVKGFDYDAESGRFIGKGDTE